MNSAPADDLASRLINTNTPLRSGSHAETLGLLEAKGDQMALAILSGSTGELEATARAWLQARGITELPA